MRVVLDTNVVVSALLIEASVPAQVIDLWLAGDIDIVVDERIIAEYREVLARPELGLNKRDVALFLGALDYAQYAVGIPLPVTLGDPDDMPFLEVAAAAAADAIVTGNLRHFRTTGGRLAIPILTPRQVLERIAGR